MAAASLADISEMVLQLQGTMMKMENFQKLLELKKDLTGIDELAVPSRVPVRFDTISTVFSFVCFFLERRPRCFVLQEFIRLGCLSKLSGKGLQQRMFFLVGTLALAHSLTHSLKKSQSTEMSFLLLSSSSATH